MPLCVRVRDHFVWLTVGWLPLLYTTTTTIPIIIATILPAVVPSFPLNNLHTMHLNFFSKTKSHFRPPPAPPIFLPFANFLSFDRKSIEFQLHFDRMDILNYRKHREFIHCSLDRYIDYVILVYISDFCRRNC